MSRSSATGEREPSRQIDANPPSGGFLYRNSVALCPAILRVNRKPMYFPRSFRKIRGDLIEIVSSAVLRVNRKPTGLSGRYADRQLSFRPFRMYIQGMFILGMFIFSSRVFFICSGSSSSGGTPARGNKLQDVLCSGTRSSGGTPGQAGLSCS